MADVRAATRKTSVASIADAAASELVLFVNADQMEERTNEETRKAASAIVAFLLGGDGCATPFGELSTNVEGVCKQNQLDPFLRI